MEKQGNTIVVQTERKWGCLAFLLVFVVGSALGVFGTSEYFRYTTKMVETPDTVYVPETLRIPSPPVTKYIKIPYAWMIPVKDTVTLRDTLYMYLEKEVKEYGDSTFFARVSGYQPSLDYIEVYQKKEVITKELTVVPKKNFVSLGMGVGYVGGFRAPVYLEYERRLSDNYSVHGRIVHDMPRKTTGLEVGGTVNFGW